MKKNNEVAVVADEASLALLRNAYPEDRGFTKVSYPRMGMYSKDVVEETKNPKTGKKEIKVLTEAGTFYLDKPGEEIDEATGKKKWVREELSNEIEVIIVYQRKQLKLYDGQNKKYTSSTVYDDDDETVLLFKDKVQVAKGIPKELQAREEYMGKNAAGKPSSNLKLNRILFVLYKGEMCQLDLSGSSMFAFLTYKKNIAPNTVVTKITSEFKENGAVSWNQMIFTVVRVINGEEVGIIMDKLSEIKGNIEAEKGYFAARDMAEGSTTVLSESEADKMFNGIK